MSAIQSGTNGVHEVEQNTHSGSTMHMFVRNGRVTLSEENTTDPKEEGRNRQHAWIRCDDSLLTDVEQ